MRPNWILVGVEPTVPDRAAKMSARPGPALIGRAINERMSDGALRWLVVVGVVVVGVRSAGADEPPPKSGGFGLGFHLQVGVGATQGISSHATAVHLVPRVGLEYERYPWLSIVLSGRIQRGMGEPGKVAFAQANVGGGVMLRSRTASRKVAGAVGGGVRIGGFVASNALLGLEIDETLEMGDDQQVGFPLAPYAHASVEWWPYRALALKLGVECIPMFFAAGQVYAIEQMFSVAVSL